MSSEHESFVEQERCCINERASERAEAGTELQVDILIASIHTS